RLLHPATSRRMLHDVRTPRSGIAMVRAYLNSRGHPPFTTTGRAIVKAYFDSVQNQHAPQSYFAYGGMRTPQEVPARTAPLLAAVEKMGIEVAKPRDHGMTMIGRAHDLGYLRFLESAHRRWPEAWGEEVLSNIFVRSPNPMHGVLAEAAHSIADASSP